MNLNQYKGQKIKVILAGSGFRFMGEVVENNNGILILFDQKEGLTKIKIDEIAAIIEK